MCSCDPGFSLDSDERSCVGKLSHHLAARWNTCMYSHVIYSINPTADQPCDDGGGCSHICAVVSGQAQCYCPLGLQLIEGTQCVGEC